MQQSHEPHSAAANTLPWVLHAMAPTSSSNAAHASMFRSETSQIETWMHGLHLSSMSGPWRAAPRVRCSRPRCAAHVIVACFALILLHCTLPMPSYSPTTALRPLTVRAASAERSNMHGHNFSAPAAQSDEL